ncbi:beta-caryophyllene synthase, partial [Tanacetum coccineum]
MERGSLSSGGRGVKQKKGVNISGNVSESGNVVTSGNGANQISQIDRNVNDGPSDIQTSTDEPLLTMNTKGLVSFTRLVTREPSRKSMNFRTLITPAGNRADVAVPLESIRVVSEWFAYSAYGFFLGKRVTYQVAANYVRNTWSKYGLVKSMLNSSNGLLFFQFSSKDCLDAMLENGHWFIRNNTLIPKKWDSDVKLLKEDVGNVSVWVKLHGFPMTVFSEDGLSGRSSYARAMIELRADVKLKDTIVVAIRKHIGEGFYMCTIRVEYEWKPPRQATRRVSVGPKISFKSTKQIYIPVYNKNGSSSSGKKKQAKMSRQKVSNSNPFDALNLIENDDDLERQIIDGKLMFVDNDGNPLVPMRNVDSKSEMKLMFKETVNLMASTSFKGGSDRGCGTNRLLEQWRETKQDDDYDPYDDDLYESHDMYDHLQAICDDLDISAEIRTFLNYLRPVLMIDAAHLKGLYKGTNLVVVAMGGNNQIVPIAFGICKRHAAIALAVEKEFPLSFHV